MEIITWIWDFIKNFYYAHGFLLTALMLFAVLAVFIEVFFVRLPILMYKSDKEVAEENGENYEKHIVKEFKKYFDTCGGRVYHHILLGKVPYQTETDVIMISKKGIFPIECKYHKEGMYTGSITASTMCITDGALHSQSVTNPLHQNNYHIKELSKYLGLSTSYFYNVVCTNRHFDLYIHGNEYLSVKKGNNVLSIPEYKAYFIAQNHVDKFKAIYDTLDDILTDEEVEKYNKMLESKVATKKQMEIFKTAKEHPEIFIN